MKTWYYAHSEGTFPFIFSSSLPFTLNILLGVVGCDSDSVAEGKEEEGPFSSSQMAELFASGQLSGDSLVRHSDQVQYLIL